MFQEVVFEKKTGAMFLKHQSCARRSELNSRSPSIALLRTPPRGTHKNISKSPIGPILLFFLPSSLVEAPRRLWSFSVVLPSRFRPPPNPDAVYLALRCFPWTGLGAT